MPSRAEPGLIRLEFAGMIVDVGDELRWCLLTDFPNRRDWSKNFCPRWLPATGAEVPEQPDSDTAEMFALETPKSAGIPRGKNCKL
jgi:hypothetical protein